jgi:hypothetical protein
MGWDRYTIWFGYAIITSGRIFGTHTAPYIRYMDIVLQLARS